jgi:hypothetical protein
MLDRSGLGQATGWEAPRVLIQKLQGTPPISGVVGRLSFVQEMHLLVDR